MQTVNTNTIYQFEGFYVSYNSLIKTTALALDAMERFYILKGDHVKAYQELAANGFNSCFDYFKRNIHFVSEYSDKENDKIMITKYIVCEVTQTFSSDGIFMKETFEELNERYYNENGNEILNPYFSHPIQIVGGNLFQTDDIVIVKENKPFLARILNYNNEDAIYQIAGPRGQKFYKKPQEMQRMPREGEFCLVSIQNSPAFRAFVKKIDKTKGLLTVFDDDKKAHLITFDSVVFK